MRKAIYFLRLIGRCFWLLVVLIRLAWTGKIFEEDEE